MTGIATTISGGESVAVGAENRQILRPMVSSIAVDVFNLKDRESIVGVNLIESALGAGTVDLDNQI